ncbi:MAG TPA: hypothetical protein VLA73_02995 [Burkholderiales bacterium]|nr:hypothetical protein [Burkholderiales bacterium]
MRALPAPELLRVWEQGLAQSPIERALALLAAGGSEEKDVLAELSIGERDTRLLALREKTFGANCESLVACPGCGEQLELAFTLADMRRAPEGAAELSVDTDQHAFNFRLPNSIDLAEAAGARDERKARELLLDRCLLNDGDKVLPDEVLDRIAERMERADPQANVRLDLHCPVCDHVWQAVFDIESYFWTEIDAWAQRTLKEVHALASAYGWRELDILNMTPWRRRMYLGML